MGTGTVLRPPWAVLVPTVRLLWTLEVSVMTVDELIDRLAIFPGKSEVCLGDARVTYVITDVKLLSDAWEDLGIPIVTLV